MGIGRQVADAYIDVHGDLSKFRNDLNDANGTMEDWAKGQSKTFSEAWGERMRSQMDRQWNSVIDAMQSGKRLDFNRMIDNFDDSDLVSAFSRINDMMQTMEQQGKMSRAEMDKMSNSIARQIELIEAGQDAETQGARAHQKMMAERAVAMQAEKKMLTEAFAQNARFDAAKRKMLNEAFAQNARFDAARRKSMQNAIVMNEQWKKSFSGILNASKEMDLDRKFQDLGKAMATNDWSGVARGANNMRQLREQTTATATEMRDLGRMTDEQFAGVQDRLRLVGQNLNSYNVRFGDANKSADKHSRSWSLIERMIGNAGKKFAGFTGLNVMGDIFRDGARFFQDLDRNAVKIGKMALTIGTLGSAVVSMLGGVAVVGQDLAKLAQIGVLGPAFLVGAGIQAAVLMSALKDMGTVLKDLKPAFAGLQDTISSNFWDVAAQPIRDMVGTLLPTLQTKLGETATAWGRMFEQMAVSLASLRTEDIGTMFDRMNAGIANASGAIDPLIQAFYTMGMVGSEYFERFGTWITNLSTQFNDFIQGAAADGRLHLWIDEAIQSFKDVWSILGSAVGIFNSIGNAAEEAGIGGLSVLATNLEKVSTVMNSPGFQMGLATLFAGAADATRSVGTAIGELGPALQGFMPTLAGVLSTIGDTVSTVIGYIGEIMSNPAVQKGLTDFMAGIQSGVEALGPAIGPMGDSLGQIGTLLGQVAEIVGTLVSAMVTNLSPILDKVTEAFGRITFAAGPEIEKIIGTIGEVLGKLVDVLLPPLEKLVMTLLPLIAPAFEAITPIIDALLGVLGPILEGIGALVDMIAPYLVPAFEKISAALSPVIEVIGILVSAILSVLVPILGFLLIGIINNLVGVFQGLSDFIMGFVDIVTAIFTGFGEFFTKLFEGDIGGALGALGTMFQEVWDGIVKMLGGALEFLWNAVQLIFIGKLIGGIKSGLSTIAGFFKNSWDDILAFFRQSWDDIYRVVSDALGKMTGSISSGMTKAKDFVVSGLQAIGRFFTNLWDDFLGTTSRGASNVVQYFKELPGRFISGLGNVGNLLKGAGQAIIDGLLAGLKASWGAVTSFVGGIATWIKDNKGPLPYDRALLIPAGNAIMEGLGKGLEDKLGMLKGVLETVTDTMTDSVTDAFANNKMYLAGADAALGLADGLKSNKSAVASALSAVMPAASTSVSASLVGTHTGGSEGGWGSNPPAGSGMVIEAGAIAIHTPTKNPEIVASKVIDEFASYSNL